MNHTPRVSDESPGAFPAEFPNWKVVDRTLRAHFTFTDLRETSSFLTLIAIESEVEGHYPTWSNTYNQVDFVLATHDTDDAITEKDCTLARYITETAHQWG